MADHQYLYGDLDNLTREELFFWIAIDTTLDQLGGTDLAAAAAVLSGQPFIPTRAKFGGATKGTSAASIVMRNTIKARMPFALPMITGKSIFTLKIAYTRNLGAFIGRAIPGVGWMILAYDVAQIIQKTVSTYNAVAHKEDRFW